MSAPAGPPPAAAMRARLEAAETRRRREFAQLRQALEDSGGNESWAAADLGWTRNRVHKLVQRFGLGEWATALRIAFSGRALGRPSRKRQSGPKRGQKKP